jgi:hypothetical protein
MWALGSESGLWPERSAKTQKTLGRAQQAWCTEHSLLFSYVSSCHHCSPGFSDRSSRKCFVNRRRPSLGSALDTLVMRASHSLTGYPAESGSSGTLWGETPKQLSAARCLRSPSEGVNTIQYNFLRFYRIARGRLAQTPLQL